MPIINFDYNQIINGFKNERVKGFLQDGATVIQAASDSIYNQEAQKTLDLLFNVKKMNSMRKVDILEDGIGEFTAVADGNTAPVDKTNYVGEREYKPIMFRHHIYWTKFYLDHEAFNEADVTKFAEFPNMAMQTKVRAAMKAYANGESTSMTTNNAVIPLACYDGKALFANDHTYGVADGHAYGTQSNLFYTTGTVNAGLIHDVVSELAVKIRQMKNANGEALGRVADVILIPGNAGGAFENAVKAVVGSDLLPGSANNDINALKDTMSYKILPDWTPAQPEIILLSSLGRDDQGATFYINNDLEIDSEYVKSDRTLHVYGYTAFAPGFTNYTFAAKCKFNPGSTSNMTQL